MTDTGRDRPRARQRPRVVASLVAVATLSALAIAGVRAAPPAAPIRLGALFPLRGPAAASAADERLGVEIARSLVNAAGGVGGRQVQVETVDASDVTTVPAVIDSLHADGVPLVIGAYSSDLSIAASAEAQRDGMVYWESGAVADQVTGRGLPLVFRVGASGANLGANTAAFAASRLAPMMGLAPAALRVSLVVADDDYANSVADAAATELGTAGFTVASRSEYDVGYPRWDRVLSQVRAAAPDLLVLASHVPDGESFTRAFVASGIRVRAFLGSTMAQCEQQFGDALGQTAVGIFASDRPGEGFDPSLLPTAMAQADYGRLATAWAALRGGAPTEEGISGFTAAWALLHDVLPAAASGGLFPASIAAAARAADLPAGTLPNGAGLRFAGDGPRLGQNLLASAVVWQWQASRRSVVVWPPHYATGAARLVSIGGS